MYNMHKLYSLRLHEQRIDDMECTHITFIRTKKTRDHSYLDITENNDNNGKQQQQQCRHITGQTQQITFAPFISELLQTNT